MAELKTKPTESDVRSFLATVADPIRREDGFTLLDLMQEVTGEPPKLWGTSIVGYGSYHYKYASGHEGDSCVVGFSPRKNELTLYVGGVFERHQDLMARLGKHKTGKGCLYIKKLADVDLGVLRELVRLSVQEKQEGIESAKVAP
jgi:Domain of unknown function (DU1801)